MILTLEVVGPQAAKLGAAHRKVFGSVGGTLGRLPDNDWVLPDPYVSGRHVRIQYLNGQFFLEDTSTNGVFINSPDRRLPKGQPYALKHGDRFFVDVYEIRATIVADEPAGDPFAYAAHASPPVRPSMPIPDDPFGLQGAPDALADASESDPLRLLGLENPPPPPQAPKAADLAGGSPLNQHFRPPEAHSVPVSMPVPPPVQSGLIPDDFDPLAADSASTPGNAASSARPGSPVAPSPAHGAAPAPRPRASGSASAAGAAPAAHSAASARESAVPAAPRGFAPPAEPRGVAPPAPRRPPAPPASPRAGAPPAAPAAPAVSAPPAALAPPAPPRAAKLVQDSAPARAAVDLDLKALLAGAGIESGALSPEAAESFGQILRVVVAGLMDLLRARERIKSEFRIQMTTFKPADNNPLKFSANVEDALHNLLVKRNAAYLGPVEAFRDAFQDVRNHQMAMLAGVRVAFESMLREFDPERLQEEFDRQLKKGSILSVPAKLRYWELYRELFRDTVKDADASFRILFGDEFAKAYEEQLEKLRALSRSGGKQSDNR